MLMKLTNQSTVTESDKNVKINRHTSVNIYILTELHTNILERRVDSEHGRILFTKKSLNKMLYYFIKLTWNLCKHFMLKKKYVHM